MYEPSVINRVAIGDIIRRVAGRFPTKTAFIENENRVTFQEIDELSNQFANYLLDKGFKKGDSIATFFGISIEFVVTIFGVAKAGLIWVPINPGITLADKKYILNEVHPKLIIGKDILLQTDMDVYESVCETVTLDGKLDTFRSLIASQPKREPEVEIHDHDLAQIMFTSGTTGKPKGVLISHLSVYLTSLNNAIEFNVKSTDIAAATLPLFHCAQHGITLSYINVGATNVIITAFEPESFMETIEREKINVIGGLPMMFRALLYHPSRKKYDLSSLRMCLYGMAPMDRTTLEMFIKEFQVDLILGSGQTEMYPVTTILKPEEQLRRFGSYWGVSTMINDTAAMDEEGNILEVGEVGEIVHRGPNVMMGYLNNEEETLESRRFGWHHTGDLGYWDEDRQLVFVDRKKDLIKTGGENVASIKVEQVLLGHEKIANVVAIGVPHEYWGEAVTAVVVPKPGFEIMEEELIIYCKEHLGAFEVPKSVIIEEEFPTTSTGKIQKNVLRTKYVDYYQLET